MRDQAEGVSVRDEFIGTGAKLPCVIGKVVGERPIGRILLPEATQFGPEQRKPPVLRL